jgi:hypothetical protein
LGPRKTQKTRKGIELISVFSVFSVVHESACGALDAAWIDSASGESAAGV